MLFLREAIYICMHFCVCVCKWRQIIMTFGIEGRMNESHFVLRKFSVYQMALMRLYSLCLTMPSLHSYGCVHKVETDAVIKVKVIRNLQSAAIDPQDSNLTWSHFWKEKISIVEFLMRQLTKCNHWLLNKITCGIYINYMHIPSS